MSPLFLSYKKNLQTKSFAGVYKKKRTRFRHYFIEPMISFSNNMVSISKSIKTAVFSRVNNLETASIVVPS
jgi:hypothetical protein